MRQRILLSILPLFFLFSCSTEDPEVELPDPKAEEPLPPEDEKDSEPPSVPQGLQVTETTFESLSISWSASTDNHKVEKYLIYLNGTPAEETSSTSITLSDLSMGNQYSLQVAAVDASGNSSSKSKALEAATAEDTEPPSIPEALSLTEITQTTAHFSWNASNDNAGVLEYDLFLNAEYLATTADTTFTVESLEPGTVYSFDLLSRDIYENMSERSETIEFETEKEEASPPEDSDGLLFISEYIEGSSDNKALEIANLSGSTIDLGEYSLRKIANKNQEWGDEKKLQGTLESGGTFVIAHERSIAAMLEKADLLMGGGLIDFNGNDVIGLFRNGELIDILGATGGEDFAKDITLRRKTSITAPTASYNPDDWESFEKDTVDGLGKL